MPGTIIVGSAFGDEAKGRCVQHYSRKNKSIVVRYNGGPNAGHTLYKDGIKYVLRLIPSGIINSNTTCYISSGVIVDPFVLASEIDKLSKLNLNGRLFISENCHIITHKHIEVDSLDSKIGTTKKGVGPALASKITRNGIRLKEFLELSELDNHTLLIQQKIKPFVIRDVSERINYHLDKNHNVVFEGAQGTFLDIDHGTYPYVTSSNTIAGAACTGSGVGPTKIDSVVLVSKVYTTRVGNGPFSTELYGVLANKLRDAGQEYGSVTGRPRRVGWLDLDQLNYAIKLNGATSLALTKLDVLTGFPLIKLFVNGNYVEFPGWEKDITNCKTFGHLPSNAINFIEFIHQNTNILIEIIGVGPNEDQVILL